MGEEKWRVLVAGLQENNCREFGITGFLQQDSKRGDGRCLVDRYRRKITVEGLRDGAEQFQRGGGVAAQIKKVLIGADSREAAESAARSP